MKETYSLHTLEKCWKRKILESLIWFNWLILDSGEMIRKEEYENTNDPEEKYENYMA